LTVVETRISGCEDRQKELAALLADPDRLGDRGRVTAAAQELEEIQQELESLLARWEELESKRGS
jgi:hypothetical protein